MIEYDFKHSADAIESIKDVLDQFASNSNMVIKRNCIVVASRWIEKFVKEKRKALADMGYEPTDCMNLGMIVTSKTPQKNYIIIKIKDVIVPVKISDDIKIEEDFDPFLYSINKHGKSQVVEYACKLDEVFYRLYHNYRNLKKTLPEDDVTEDKPYKVGDRICLKPIRGNYEIVKINKSYVVVTCRKWQETYGSMNQRKYHISDIEGLYKNNPYGYQETNSNRKFKL